LQLSLTGADDFGAHASLTAAGANLDGTVRVLAILRPLLRGRLETAPIDAAVDRARSALAATGGGDVRTLPRVERERVDAAFSALAEELAPVAAVLEPRRAS
jgi:iron uptake system component EfeO